MIMMAFRFLRLFRLWLLASLNMSPDRLHFIPLFLKLFCLCKFVFPFFLNLVRLVFRTAFGGPWFLAWGSCPSLFLALVRLFFSSIFLVSKSCEVLGLARLGFCISFDFPLFLAYPCTPPWVLVAPLFCA